MNKKVIRLVVLGLTGVTLFTMHPVSAGAAIHTDSAIAGITLSLNNYIAANGSQVIVTEEPEEEFVLNLVYDRLGIAKVDNYLNVRKKPNEEAELAGKMPKNSGCHIYKIKNGWAKIVSGKVKGWVKAEYLITDEEAEDYAKEVATKMATVVTDTLKVRALPTTEAKVCTLVPGDEELEVVKEHITEDYLRKYIERHKDDENCLFTEVNDENMMAGLDDWMLIKVDDEKAFINKHYVDISYKLERAVRMSDIGTEADNGGNSLRYSMVEYAKQFLGNRYVYGGTSLTNGTDCSGFTMRIYEHFGYSIPRTSSSQASAATSIRSSDVLPGDLFFYGSGGHVNHVAMYIGDGLVIHASSARTGIKISNAYYRTPVKIGRFI